MARPGVAPASRLCANAGLLAVGDPAVEVGIAVTDRAVTRTRFDCRLKSVVAKRALRVNCPPKAKQRRAKKVAAVLVEKEV